MEARHSIHFQCLWAHSRSRSPVLAGAVGFTLFLFTRAAVLRSHACFRRTLVLFGPTVGFVVAVNMLVTLYEV